MSSAKPTKLVGGNTTSAVNVHTISNTICSLGTSLAIRPTNSIDIDLARKQIEGQRSFFFFGFNSGVGTSFEDIHPSGGNINWQQTASVIAIQSTNINDDITGLGCRSVEIHGLAGGGTDTSEVIELAGTTTVYSVNSYVRLNLMHNEQVGTYGGSHQGDIKAFYNTVTGDMASVMAGVEGSTNSSVQYGMGEACNGYTSVPLDKVLYITSIEVEPNIGSNKTVDVILYEREGILNVTAPFDPRRVLWNAIEFDHSIKKPLKSFIKIKQLTDVFFRARGSSSSKIAVHMDYYLLDRNSQGE